MRRSRHDPQLPIDLHFSSWSPPYSAFCQSPPIPAPQPNPSVPTPGLRPLISKDRSGNGWGRDLSTIPTISPIPDTAFAQVPRLKLKWALRLLRRQGQRAAQAPSLEAVSTSPARSWPCLRSQRHSDRLHLLDFLESAALGPHVGHGSRSCHTPPRRSSLSPISATRKANIYAPGCAHRQAALENTGRPASDCGASQALPCSTAIACTCPYRRSKKSPPRSRPTSAAATFLRGCRVAMDAAAQAR